MGIAFFIAWRDTVITVLQRCATYLQPSGSDTSTGSERISRLPFCPFNPSQKNFLEHPPHASPLYLYLPGRRARSARRPLFRGEKKFFGGHFQSPPQFLKPQILAETLRRGKKTQAAFASSLGRSISAALTGRHFFFSKKTTNYTNPPRFQPFPASLCPFIPFIRFPGGHSNTNKT